ncbi:MAG: HNH endonuclease [Alistipes sp.]|nr:HNH endonuclease [Alistipes sp.]
MKKQEQIYSNSPVEEIWRQVDGTQGRYEISSFGRFRFKGSLITYKDGRKRYYPPHIVKTRPDKNGYPLVSIRNNGKHNHFKIHRLVASTFIPNPSNKREVNHINGIKSDNRVENLEWVTSSENKLHAIAHKLSYPIKNLKIYRGAEHYKAKTLVAYKDGVEIKRYTPINLSLADGIKLKSLYKQMKANRPYKGLMYKVI